MRLSSRKRCDIRSINYSNFPKDFFDECDIISQPSSKKINMQESSSKEFPTINEANITIKINVGNRRRDLNKNARYLWIKGMYYQHYV